MLSDILLRIPEESAVLELVSHFNNLLRKYANYLRYEDAYNDLLVFFLELIQGDAIKSITGKDDKIITSYIYKSVRSKYIKLSKAFANKQIPFSDLSDERLYYIESQMSYTVEDGIAQYWSDSILSDTESKVLHFIYEYGHSVQDTAKILGVSRQAVNQTKLRAIKKVKEHLLL